MNCDVLWTLRAAALVLVFGVIAGCATRAPAPLPPVEERAPAPVATPQPRSNIPVVMRLVAQAEAEYDSGRIDQAIATAERGLRIDRRVPELYLLLARGYRNLDNATQARQFAEQGLRYVADSNSEVASELRFLLSQLP